MRVLGTPHWDRVMTRAAKKVLVVAERVEPVATFQERPEMTLVPHFMVDAVAVVPHGAWPGSCHPDYPIDYPAVERYLTDTDEAFAAHLAEAPETREEAVRG